MSWSGIHKCWYIHVVNALIRNEVDSGIPSERIVIGGFSQGISAIVCICDDTDDAL